jgi:hypothetical protein
MLVIKVESITLLSLQQIMNDNKPGSILFLIPEVDIGAEKEKEWRRIEEWLLIQKDLKMAVWFAVENDQTRALYQNLEIVSDQMTLVVESAEPVVLKKVELANVQGLLTGLASATSTSSQEGEDGSSGDVTKIPTIAITATWDSVASVPGLAFGANADASGVVAMFHLARSISKLYANSRTQARYNVVFLLTSGTELNYAGTRHWVDTSATGSAVRDSLDWVLCLDGLARDGGLYLHASRPSKDPKAARLYDTFTSVAEKHGIPISVVQKKINIADASVGWEHELYARRKILAVTLSQHSSPSERGGIFDNTKKINIDAFSKNILFVTEVVTRLIYQQDLNAPSIASFPNATLTQGWLATLTQQPRMVPFVDSKHALVDYIESTLKQFAPDVSRQTFRPDSDRSYYDAISSTLTSYRTQPFTYDLTLFAFVIGFNAILYTLLIGNISTALADFAALASWIKGRFISSSTSSASSASKKSKKM